MWETLLAFVRYLAQSVVQLFFEGTYSAEYLAQQTVKEEARTVQLKKVLDAKKKLVVARDASKALEQQIAALGTEPATAQEPKKVAVRG